MLFQPQDIIHSYTRKQAIDDGFQICISEHFQSDTRMYRYPVFFTTGVWELCQGQGAIVWDICYMAAAASKAQPTDSAIVQYSVIVEGASRTPDFFEDTCPCYRLWAICEAKDIDDPTPVITILFPDER
ncbi:MAG: hypothetical protein HC939_24340 [Pleurocapsa sp. SU_5_0]|nr:hypothetical protein [Pleurocapsa sp. SU_5_0]